MQTLAERFAMLPQIGRLEWIGVSPAPRAEMLPLTCARLLAGQGLEGDHHARRAGGSRQVTLLQHEHLDVLARLLHREQVFPADLRRNLVVSGINLLALKNRRFRIGDCELFGTGPCEPCSRMEETFGPGGWNAVRGHGGITARVEVGGVIQLGDAVVVVTETHEPKNPEKLA